MRATKRSIYKTKRHSLSKVFVPANNRENQYLLLELPLDYCSITEIPNLYKQAKHSFFEICKSYGIHNAAFVANDKWVKVRFGEENLVTQTNKQTIISYDPRRFFGYRSYYDFTVLAQKAVFVILAEGEDIRQQAVHLHQIGTAILSDLALELDVSVERFKIRDFQHITYDLFAADKNDKATQTHGFRSINKRYNQQGLIIPAGHQANHFVSVKIPITFESMSDYERTAKLQEMSPYYSRLCERIQHQIDEQGLFHSAIIANGKEPFISSNSRDFKDESDEVIKLGFDKRNDNKSNFKIVASHQLIDHITVVISARDVDMVSNSFAAFVNRCHQAIAGMVTDLNIDVSRVPVICRFYQHLQYTLSPELDYND